MGKGSAIYLFPKMQIKDFFFSSVMSTGCFSLSKTVLLKYQAYWFILFDLINLKSVSVLQGYVLLWPCFKRPSKAAHRTLKKLSHVLCLIKMIPYLIS